jgi:sulfoxide reductase heme-binding subunit YedZ
VKYVKFDKFIVLINGLVPAGMMWWDVRHNVFANPVEYVLHTTGLLAVIFLTLTLTVTPLRKLTGWNYLSHFRRMLGLYAFFYAVAHFCTYFWKDKDLSVQLVFDDVIQRPFILLGMTALLCLVPLAATSTNAAIKWLGAARWKKLHQLSYVAAGAAAWHFYQFPKADRTKPLILIGILTVLFLYRIVENYRAEWKKKKAAAAAIPFATKAQ